ncbi:MAG TPA: putative Ig domain-containing protein, partial [Candidatus Poseidoniales archaeon]|nr:putative Ig domain-containing protein [Candidatus Poseidoniales archaeon]
LPAGVEATSVAVGWEHACAILDNGSVMCWGKGTGGRLGNNGSITQSDQKVPVNVVLPANRSAVTLSASYSHTCAVMDNGSATCWGYNPYGQLGLNGAATDITRGYFGKAITAEYVELPSGRAVTGVSTHDRHTCWTLDNESVMCTGSNVNYALGRANLSDCTTVDSTVICDGLMDGTSTVVNELKYVKWLPKVKANPGRATWYGTPADTTNGKTLTAWANTTSTSASARAILRVVPATDYTTASLSIPSSGAISVTPTNNCDWCTYSIEPALPNWMSIDTSSAAITGTSPLGDIGFSGTYTITGTASNGSDTTSITLTSNAATPIVTLVNGFEASVDTPLNSTVISGASTFETSGSPTNMPFTTTGNGLLDANSISAAGESSCAVWADGGMKCWGHDGEGQLGNGGTTGNKNTPSTSVSLPASRDAVATTSGSLGHSCAIVDNGDAYCWGEGEKGKLGYGKTVDKTSPQKVGLPSGRDAVDISAGGYHSCAVLDNGSAMCWGWNQGGRLGDGTTTQRKNPSYVDLPLGKAATEISAGEVHTCAAMTDGTAYCWGNNNKGQFGIGSTSPSSSSTPTQVSLPSGVKAISIGVGSEFTCALMDDGDVYCWGEGDAGRLGNGATTDKSSPTKITMPSGDAIKLSVGYDTACMVMDNGAARCWGEGSDGQIGEGKTNDRTTSRAVSIPSGRKVTDIHTNADGALSDDAHTCAILDNGTAMCWGERSYGKIGNGGSTAYLQTPEKSPVYVSLTDGLMPVPETHRWHGTPNTPSSGITYTNWANNTSSASYSSNLNIRVLGAIDYGASSQAVSVGSVNVAGTVYCDWCTYSINPSLPSGLSLNRANGTISGSISAVTYDWTATFTITALAHNGSNTTTLSLTHTSASALTQATTYLGFKDIITTSLPDSVLDDSQTRGVEASTPGFDFLTDGLNPSDLIAGGGKSNCAAFLNESLACWGLNTNGELGLGFVSSVAASSTQKYPNAQYVDLGSDARVKQITVGTNHACAVLVGGDLTCWGANTHYQLGRGYANSSATNLTATPTIVDLGTGVKAAQVVAGDYHTCVMTESGAVKCWGKNGAGQIGAGYTNTTGTMAVHTPVSVDLGTGRTAVSLTAGDEHNCAILDNADLVCWGLNWQGQLGLGNTADKNSPKTVDLADGRTAVDVAAGSAHTCAILDNGNVKCWGFNGDGSVGDGTWTDRTTPKKVDLGTDTATQVSVGDRQTCVILQDDSMNCWGAN